jgi:hypothetical protein
VWLEPLEALRESAQVTRRIYHSGLSQRPLWFKATAREQPYAYPNLSSPIQGDHAELEAGKEYLPTIDPIDGPRHDHDSVWTWSSSTR